VVNAGHVLLKKKADEPLAARCDSFVVKTHVHYPTDINLLWDAVRKTIEICAQLCQSCGLSDWRQSEFNLRRFKKRYRTAQQLKRCTAQDESKREAQQKAMRDAHRDYINQARTHLRRAAATRVLLQGVLPLEQQAQLTELDTFMAHGERQIEQIERRVLQGQSIPHDEKVFSIFQPHTEWISKGKAGVPQELGLRVCVVVDQHRFILTHQVMEKTTDDKVAVAITQQAKQRFASLRCISMDKGFHSPQNQEQLKAVVDMVVLPKKGKLSVVEQKRQAEPEFAQLRRQHSAVESAINALEQHGLDVCPDHGMHGFKRYVALAVVARNVQRLGAVLREQEKRDQQKEAERWRRRHLKKAA
jgi:transposase, IS5 family